jgi:hypothetical protein
MTTKKKSSSYSFKGKVANSARRDQSGGGTKYLKLPKGISLFKPEPGSKSVLLDFLPYIVSNPKHPDRDVESKSAMEGSPWWRLPYKVHKNIGAGNGETVVCLQSIGKKCPVCIKREELRNSDADEDEVKALNSSDRVLYVVIPIKNKKYEETVHVLDISFAMFGKLLKEELDEKEENEVFPQLEGGKTLRVRFSSKSIGKGKPFPEATKIEFEERESDYDEEIMEESPCLDDMLRILSYKELQAKFLENEDEDDGGDLDDEDDEEEDEKPSRTKKSLKKKPTKKKVEDDDDDEEEEEDEDEDDEDEEDDDEPVKKSSKKKPVKKGHDDDDDEEDEDDEDEDDDEEEEEEEEDEKPVRKHKTVTRRR